MARIAASSLSLVAVLCASPASAQPAADHALLEPIRRGQATLRLGARGPAVAALQRALNAVAAAGLRDDGAFGPRTQAAVLAFQRAAGLASDGVVGPRTLAALDRALAAPTPPAPTPSPPGVVLTTIPPRPAWAQGGSAVLARTDGLSRAQRDALLAHELEQGNLPDALRTFRSVTVTALGPDGRRLTGSFLVMPDYLAVGDAGDFLRAPLTPAAAQRVADRFGCALPTRRMVDAIWREAPVKLDPIPLPPSAAMMSNDYLRWHHARVEAARAGVALRTLTAGHKKDVVLSERLRMRPDRVAIYGWHRRDGRPIQPLSTVHEASYADYSHGARLVWGVVTVEGQTMPLADALRDPVLHVLFSDEGPLSVTRIP